MYCTLYSSNMIREYIYEYRKLWTTNEDEMIYWDYLKYPFSVLAIAIDGSNIIVFASVWSNNATTD